MTRVTRVLLACGIVGPLLFIVVFLVEGATRPGYSAWRNYVSELALSSDGWQQIANFVICGALLSMGCLQRRRAALRDHSWLDLDCHLSPSPHAPTRRPLVIDWDRMHIPGLQPCQQIEKCGVKRCSVNGLLDINLTDIPPESGRLVDEMGCFRSIELSRLVDPDTNSGGGATIKVVAVPMAFPERPGPWTPCRQGICHLF